MSASLLYLAELPAEILEHVLLYLPGQDIIKMEAVSRHFQALIRNSPSLQYRCELFTSGLIDNPCYPYDLVERRKLREEYEHKWSDAAVVVKSAHKLPPNQSSLWGYSKALGRNTILSYSTLNGGLDFLYIPPVASRTPINGWNIPSFPFNALAIGVYHPDNVLAVVERQEDLLRIHLLNLQDGSPCCTPPSNVITWAVPQDMPQITGGKLTITGSRVLSCLSHPDADLPGRTMWTALVWDRKTGKLVLDLSAAHWRGSISAGVVFLDEFRIIVPTRYTGIDPPELIVFNTLIPQDYPRNAREFSLPPRYDSDYYALIHVDRDRYLGILDKDMPLITDPTQAILVVEVSRPMRRSVLLIVRMQALIEHVCSPRTDVQVPWDEWGRGAVIMENQPFDHRLPIHVHGVHVVVLKTQSRDGRRHEHLIRTFNFGRRRYGSLPLLDREGDGTERRALFEDGKEFTLEADMFSWGGMQSLGDGTFFHPTSLKGVPDSAKTLYVWELT